MRYTMKVQEESPGKVLITATDTKTGATVWGRTTEAQAENVAASLIGHLQRQESAETD